ncbi:MAG TPA: YqgE/AlgH family protein [Verrucomicrobiae bacterium]|jgi:putative transcriptional regulator
MSEAHASLQGNLLLDGGKLHGSFFHRSVVLICQHNAEGAFGLVLNRMTESKVGDAVVANLPETIKKETLFIGGPVQPQTLSFLRSDILIPNANVMLNLNLGHSIDELAELGDSPTGSQKLKLFAGYAGWSAGQLDTEMARKDWLVQPATLELIFAPEPENLWKKILMMGDNSRRMLANSPEDLSWN